jgi:glucose-1-phosphate cytidylyltransferase
MVEIGGKPILWHIMKIYSSHGINEFIICCGYKGYLIKEYFANYFLHMSDVTFDMQNNKMEVHQRKAEPWRVTLVDTGDDHHDRRSPEAGGILPAGEEAFCFTYGDGVADVTSHARWSLSQQPRQVATLTAVQPPGRFWCSGLDGDQSCRQLQGKAPGRRRLDQWRLLRAVTQGDRPTLKAMTRLIWEREPMERWPPMASFAPTHHGFWQPMDTLRDKTLLEELWASGKAPWKTSGHDRQISGAANASS